MFLSHLFISLQNLCCNLLKPHHATTSFLHQKQLKQTHDDWMMSCFPLLSFHRSCLLCGTAKRKRYPGHSVKNSTRKDMAKGYFNNVILNITKKTDFYRFIISNHIKSSFHDTPSTYLKLLHHPTHQITPNSQQFQPWLRLLVRLTWMVATPTVDKPRERDFPEPPTFEDPFRWIDGWINA